MGFRRLMPAGGHVIVGDDEVLTTIAAKIALYEAARATLPRGKGRQTDFEQLYKAANVLREQGLPITSGSNGIGPRVVAQALWPKTWENKIHAARHVCRRLQQLIARAEGRI